MEQNGNIALAMQQASRAGGDGGGYHWGGNINNTSGGAENGCVWVNFFRKHVRLGWMQLIAYPQS